VLLLNRQTIKLWC